jgi:hypothetical protein
MPLTNSSTTGRVETACSMIMAWISENSSGCLDQATAVESAPRHTDSSTKKFLARRDLHLETVWRAIEPALSPR